MSSQSNEKRIQELASKWLDQTITPDEKQEFAAWYNAGQDVPLDISRSFAESEEELRARILDKINSSINVKTGRFPKITPIWWASIAASILLIATISFHFHLWHVKRHQSAAVIHKRHPANDVAPGGNKALLTLADGSKIVLNDAKNGVVANQGATRLNKAQNDQLIYEADTDPQKKAPVVYNTISTPKGGQFTVVLSDGT